MQWFFLGILSGFFHSLAGAASKKALQKNDYYIVAFSGTVFSLLILTLALLKLNLAPTNFTFWCATLVSAGFQSISLLLFVKALGVSEFSLVMPFLSFTPLFLIFTSKIILGELPNYLGILGILLVVGGSYVIGLNRKNGPLEPFKALGKNRGIQLMLAAAFIFALGANFNKIAVQAANPITYLIFVQLITSLILLPIAYFKSKRKLREMRTNIGELWPIGLFIALTLLPQMTALNLTIVPYIISLKRSSALFSVILGALIFKEKNLKPRLLGAAIMIAGVFLISFG